MYFSVRNFEKARIPKGQTKLEREDSEDFAYVLDPESTELKSTKVSVELFSSASVMNQRCTPQLITCIELCNNVIM